MSNDPNTSATANQTVILFDSGQTWSWDSVNWTQLQPVQSPTTQTRSAMVYDQGNKNVVLFGNDGRTTPETWTLSTAAGTVNNLNYHGGPVEKTTTNYAIFWEPYGSTVSPNFNSLNQRLFTDVGASSLYGMMTQYYQISNNQRQFIQQQSTFSSANVFVDQGFYTSQILGDGDIQAEVTHAMSVKGWTAGVGKEFFVFTAQGQKTCTAYNYCSVAQFCAYHDEFTNNGSVVLYAMMPYLDANAAGCNSATVGTSSPNNDPAADNVMTAVSHELFETITDPRPQTSIAWCDNLYTPVFFGIFGATCGSQSKGGEIGDKCNQQFGTRMPDGSDISINGHPYILQQEYSNRANGCSMQ